MPELPEVQAHAERLAARLDGALLERFEPLSFAGLKTYAPAPDEAVGERLRSLTRRGKYLLLGFGSVTFVTHLAQGGRLHADGRGRRPRGGVARWHFDGDRRLLLTEAGTERQAGVWVVRGDPLTAEPLARLGPEADALDTNALAALLAVHSKRVHSLLRDQRALAGLGRRLANEVCHRARLSPFAGTHGLDREQVERLAAAIRDCVAEGLRAERARDDMSSSRERPAAVHARVGQPCPVCGDAVRAVEYRDYTVCYCPTCQTGGRVLADNTTSRFLK